MKSNQVDRVARQSMRTQQMVEEQKRERMEREETRLFEIDGSCWRNKGQSRCEAAKLQKRERRRKWKEMKVKERNGK